VSDTEHEIVQQPVLRRSTQDKVIAGVAGGLGRYLGIDSVLVRIAFLLLAFFGGIGVLLYVIGWAAMPEEKPGEELGPAPRAGGARSRMVIGMMLVLVGSIWLLQQLLPRFDRFVGPVILIAIGLAVLLAVRR
jgi:phage shock protein C